jgi:hypothetical protein
LSRRDVYHDNVRAALVKDGWRITHDPLLLTFGERNVRVDLGAEAPLAAERDGSKIAVEIKSFLGPSAVSDLERALGRYMLYSFLLERQEPDRGLYLAVPEDTFASVFDSGAGRDLIAARSIQLIVFRPGEDVITRWINGRSTPRPSNE